MNRLVRRVDARPAIAVTNVVKRCSVFVTVSESGCGATRWPVRSNANCRHATGRRLAALLKRIATHQIPATPRPTARMSSFPIDRRQTPQYRWATERRTFLMTSRIQKRLLLPNRVRRPPEEGFSWVDRRFLKDYAARLSRDAILLYFFFTAVSDQQGLSFYSDSTIAVRLRLPEKAVSDARAELVAHDLIAWQRPLTQVLALPQPVLHRRGSLQSLGDLFRSTGNSAEKNSAGSES